MKLSDIVAAIDGAKLHGDDAVVSAITEDSRMAGKGMIFVAVMGERADGHDFAESAIENGASALLVSRKLEVSVPQILVEDTAFVMGIIAALLSGNPSETLDMIGITGTNGKTTTTFILESILQAAKRKPGVMGTVSYRVGNESMPAPFTTPTSTVLHGTLKDFVAKDCKTAVLEVSSAALSQKRIAGAQFNVAAFSNFSQDHLEYHKTMEAYLAAKTLLFSDYLAPDGTAVINIDDPRSKDMLKASGGRTALTVSMTQDADIRVTSYESSIAGISGTILTPNGDIEFSTSKLIGDYNVANVALATGIATALAVSAQYIAQGIADLAGVPGRLEPVENDLGLNIFVDYAHTPDALVSALGALRPLTEGRLICVLGCGGDRDPSKREPMGKAATEGADLVVVTSDNPRTEDPQQIIDMILPGVPNALFVDTDRRVAIAAAVGEATPSDTILIAGKGHEDYQILGTEKVHFDDREEAATACSKRYRFTIDEIVNATDGKLSGDAPEQPFNRVTIDGRTAAPRDLYVAIKGERFDGHDFTSQAVSAGARAAVVEEASSVAPCSIVVDDTRQALANIATFHRKRWGKDTLVGITGSSGKTTTKQMIALALGADGRVHSTSGSLNNETGVPLTLLGLRPFHDYAVIEMGQRKVGDIDHLRKIAQPNIAVVTNIGLAHVGVAGSIENIAKGKSQIFNDLPQDGWAVLPVEDKRLHAYAPDRRVTFGWGTGDVFVNDYTPVPSGIEIEFDVHGDKYRITLPAIGRHQASNAACALAVALALEVDIGAAAERLQHYKPSPLRGAVKTWAGRHIIVDCYNANPDSMKASLQAAKEQAQDKAVLAVLGDMLEIGEIAPAAHREIGEVACEHGFSLIGFGEYASAMVEGHGGESAVVADSYETAASLIADQTKPGDWIVLKASRGLALEKVLEHLPKKTEDK